MTAHPTDGPDRPRSEEGADGADLGARHDDVGRRQRDDSLRGHRDRSRGHQVSTGSCRTHVAGLIVRETGRVAHLVQQDDGGRHTRHRPAVQEDHRWGSGGAAGEAGTAGEGCRGPHRAPDDHHE
jgi:hypothetical protein